MPELMDEAWRALDAFARQLETHRQIFSTPWQACEPCRYMAESTIATIRMTAPADDKKATS